MVNVVMVGAGEYTAGYVPTVHGAANDKPAGVVALTCFDLRRLGVVERLVLCDRSGTRMPAVRENMQKKIGDVYRGLDLAIDCYPADDVADDPEAFIKAMDSVDPGDVCIIFTPDDTHFKIAMAAIERKLHVLVAKPVVKTLAEHLKLMEAARQHNVLVAVEYHKRFDPIYNDAHNRIRNLGPFSYFNAYMAQPKQQLDTFRAWAGKSSDISYYLNSHHIDIHNWSVQHMARPEKVTAMACTGVAQAKLGRPCEDTITLMTQWRNKEDGSVGTALYTSSWISPKGQCHTQQNFHYMGQRGELHANQALRGYNTATDEGGYLALNPLYMRYTPDAEGYFAGQNGYGYVSIARFIQAAKDLQTGSRSLQELTAHTELAVLETTANVTAILEAGRISLDNGGAAVAIEHDEQGLPRALRLAA